MLPSLFFLRPLLRTRPAPSLPSAPLPHLPSVPFSSTPTSRKQPVLPPIPYEKADARVKAIYDEMIAQFELKGPHQINDFWKILANHYPTFKGTWDRMQTVMAPGALDPLVKEMIYLAVSTTNGCDYCIASHAASARKLGMTDEMMGELQAVVAMASETNRLAFGYRVAVDPMYEKMYAKSNEKKVAERDAKKE
ncbi:AhpD-like protein [Gonapodya prolifera JEL478]|uniref:AhpD-like protein n=1 Tax=Gonapodya prolifera (strain JEL478) TaxID=1344416 RepID=A0A139A8W9_GONPJ|nr:AhpD-like protein [Gonapodya prolifera JEL478]|eukprot:KXS13196.1 AhpD-like protein [Gonapodya prolifera JEL478]